MSLTATNITSQRPKISIVPSEFMRAQIERSRRWREEKKFQWSNQTAMPDINNPSNLSTTYNQGLLEASK
jgi:hypothetical protein